MFAAKLVKQNYNNIVRPFTTKGKYTLLHSSAVHNMKYESTSKRCEHEEEEDDEDDEEDCEEQKLSSSPRACPPDPCKPPHSTAPCLPPPPPPTRGLGMPHFLGAIGPKQISVLAAFIPALFRYSVAALIALIYITDFQAVLQYLPFYNGKYRMDVDIPKAIIENEEEIVEVIEEAKKDC